jgi:hypothetical protein
LNYIHAVYYICIECHIYCIIIFKGGAMDIYKSMTVWELLSFLKSRVKQNVDQINEHIVDLREYRKNSLQDSEVQLKINQVNNEISRLTAENNEFLSIFNDLLKLHNSCLIHEDIPHNKKETIDMKVEYTDDYVSECIERTIKGELPVDELHPLLKDKESLETLFQKLMENELYEQCATIVHLREGNQ